MSWLCCRVLEANAPEKPGVAGDGRRAAEVFGALLSNAIEEIEEGRSGAERGEGEDVPPPEEPRNPPPSPFPSSLLSCPIRPLPPPPYPLPPYPHPHP